MANEQTLANFLRHLNAAVMEPDGAWLAWPPDVFAVCAYVLKVSGAYTEVLREWPPKDTRLAGGDTWAKCARKVGTAWRDASAQQAPAPQDVFDLWTIVMSRSNQSHLLDVAKDRETCQALLHLVAAADEACANVGMFSKHDFINEANILLRTTFTLCKIVPPTVLCVLPKQHTPQSGMTIRSLTHHLSLHIGREVVPHWHQQPTERPRTTDGRLTLLLAPWPLEVKPRQFAPTEPANGLLHEMPEKFGFFTYEPECDPTDRESTVASWVESLIQTARDLTGHVDAIVLPELAVNEEQFRALREVAHDAGAMLIAGVFHPAKDGRPARNEVALAPCGPTPEKGGFNAFQEDVRQSKHHRWQLDRSQIQTYGLGSALDPNFRWWESSELGERHVNFVVLDDELTICCLICEDLARQDPVADVVRSVGPNLVIALLMDGPQLGHRWPARYATVLADDPGSSVLTLTSAGMTRLSRPPPGRTPSRSIALWKDTSRSEALELELPHDADGLLLMLRSEPVEEWTADGRSDRASDASVGGSSFPRLSGVHPIKRKRP
ncbi:MAG: hypothetical protein SFX73_38035 [Kofleriaceae bacterium]|nr:hypothetical protein [Kofleriaceae bacterium]